MSTSSRTAPQKTPQLDDRSVFEEHRYDALGRRVLLRTRQAPQAFCAAVLSRSNVVRAVWDGDQLLHEVSAPVSGPDAEVDAPALAESFLGPHHYGRVLYVHEGGIDQPVAVVRSEYSDSLPRGTVYPLANHKGQYDMGISTCVLVTPRSPLLAEHGGEQQIGTDTVTHQIGDTTPYEHCVRVDWPGRSSFSSGFRRHSWGPAPPWVGSLLYHGKDPSGQMYRRNRFYDPSSGRFTQEDPIGIAGGLNVYGYANGDPITYSDPYGLCPGLNSRWWDLTDCPPGYFTAIGMTVGAVGGGIGGGMAGAAACSPTGPGALICAGGGALAGAKAGAAGGAFVGSALDAAILLNRAMDGGNGGGESRPQRQRGETSNFRHAVRELGLNRNTASEILHELKRAAGLRGADNVWINTSTGAVRAQSTGEVIGYLIP